MCPWHRACQNPTPGLIGQVCRGDRALEQRRGGVSSVDLFGDLQKSSGDMAVGSLLWVALLEQD